MRNYARALGALTVLGLTACELGVTNYGAPEIERVAGTALSLQGAVSGMGSQLFNPQRASESVNTQGKIMSEESFASVANFGMAARASNRSLISNELGNDNAESNRANYFSFQRLNRLAFNLLTAYNALPAASKATLTANETNRMRAFAYFIAGQSLGAASVAYDSLAFSDETITDRLFIPPLVSAAVANAKAMEFLDSAVTIAGRGMDAVPVSWMSLPGTTAMSQANFIQLARSYRARYRAAVARTAAERAAVNWALVIADATAGITTDHVVSINGQTGFTVAFDANQIYVVGGWHSVPMKYAGMADTSGAYQAWYNTPSSSRRAFLVRTPDKRWARGNTRALQQAATPGNNIVPVLCDTTAMRAAGQTPVADCFVYMRNRPSGDDVLIPGDGESFYDHRRYGAARANTTVPGNFTEMSATEVAMLAAEGYLRTGQPALAEPLIDRSRIKNGLPSVVGVGAGTVPGGAACVPRLPNGTCGTLLEAMKYEKRMETAFTGYMIWFTDSRGWGDLPVNTAIEWPVPYQEMQARSQPYYNGTRTFAGPSTYGF